MRLLNVLWCKCFKCFYPSCSCEKFNLIVWATVTQWHPVASVFEFLFCFFFFFGGCHFEVHEYRSLKTGCCWMFQEVGFLFSCVWGFFVFVCVWVVGCWFFFCLCLFFVLVI